MAATETKPEAKQVEEHLEPLICKTTVLRVSIHCEGCKRKVKKILQGVHGVCDINIDLRQQKVVVTGNVNSDTLLKKLTKAGKHAELWPEQPDSRKKKQGKPEGKEKHSDPESSSEEIKQSGENDNEETGNVKVVDVDNESKNVEGTTSNNTTKNSDGCGGVNVNKTNEGCATGKAGVQFQDPKPEVRQQTVVLPAVPVTVKKVSVAVQVPNENEAPANEKTGGSTSGGGKKKKKKGKANNNAANEGATASASAAVAVEHSSDAPANGGSGNRSQGHVHGLGHPGSVPISSPANESPPRHYVHHQYPPHYYAPPPPAPVCTVSYNTAYPGSSSSYGAAYYAPPQPYSYAHVVHPGAEMEPRPYTYESESYTSSQPSSSFEFFSDENPNACSVM